MVDFANRYLKEEKLHVAVYDNSSDPQSVPSYPNFEIQYFHDSANSGVSRAYNYFSAVASVKKRDWVFLLDQDSVLQDDFLLRYFSAVKEFPTIQLFAPIIKGYDEKYISPSLFFLNRGFRPKKLKYGINDLKKYSPINSGLMIGVGLFNSVNGYDENVPLDYSDFVFIKRVRKMTEQFCIVQTIVLHNLSSFEPSNIDTSKIRFNYLINAMISQKEGVWNFFVTSLVLLFQALRLTIRNKNLIFLMLVISGLKNSIKSANR